MIPYQPPPDEYAEMEEKYNLSITAEIQDWINNNRDPRPFNRREIIQDLQLRRIGRENDRVTYDALNRAIRYLIDADIIEPVPSMTFGWYRPVNKFENEMDPFADYGDDVPMWLPLDLMDRAIVYPGDIILFAGSPNVGKTALTLNIAKENALKGWRVKYFNSEMSAPELGNRLKMFLSPKESWENVKFIKRADSFQDVVSNDKNTINIIDFLQLHNDFFAIGNTFFEIHKRLGDSVCVINMQKNPGNDTALGGFRTLELPRLAVALDFQKAKIVKCKAWRNKDINPNGATCEYKIIHGHNIVPKSGIGFKWYSTPSKSKEGAA